MIDPSILFSTFSSKFPSSNETIRHFSAPARINIIGEHVDYLGGLVLPAAIDFSVHALIQRNGTDQFHLYSADFEQQIKISRPFKNSKDFPWSDYIQGVITEIEKKGLNVPGFNLLLTGNIPQGAGLSSSAALEVVVGYAISELFQLNLSRESIALIGQAAENNFVGTNCGIMDQFIIATGKEKYCISLNTSSLKYEYHEFDLGEFEFYLINSNVKHSLKDSDYNQRRLECESALSKIKKSHPNVKDLYSIDFPISTDLGLSQNESKRVGHVVSEKIRTNIIINALRDGNINSVGNALYECHWSLSNQFEVSCPETDFIVSSLKAENATGARMIGGGFGGCVLVLDKIKNFSSTSSIIEEKFVTKFGHPVSIYKFKIADGVKELS